MELDGSITSLPTLTMGERIMHCSLCNITDKSLQAIMNDNRCSHIDRYNKRQTVLTLRSNTDQIYMLLIPYNDDLPSGGALGAFFKQRASFKVNKGYILAQQVP